MKRLKYNQLERKNRCFTSHYSRYWLSNRRAFSGEERCYDFTPSVISKDAALKPDGKPWPKTGGAHHFFTFIEEELKPQIEKNFEIDKGKQTLFGHSLGGLFALHILFTKHKCLSKLFY